MAPVALPSQAHSWLGRFPEYESDVAVKTLPDPFPCSSTRLRSQVYDDGGSPDKFLETWAMYRALWTQCSHKMNMTGLSFAATRPPSPCWECCRHTRSARCHDLEMGSSSDLDKSHRVRRAAVVYVCVSVCVSFPSGCIAIQETLGEDRTCNTSRAVQRFPTQVKRRSLRYCPCSLPSKAEMYRCCSSVAPLARPCEVHQAVPSPRPPKRRLTGQRRACRLPRFSRCRSSSHWRSNGLGHVHESKPRTPPPPAVQAPPGERAGAASPTYTRWQVQFPQLQGWPGAGRCLHPSPIPPRDP
eukprot:scaffold1086_cov397-Prasinococcus_capsulatus_cf.AAC.2